MREKLVLALQFLVTLVIGAGFLWAFSDIPGNRNARWVAAILGGVGGAYILTYVTVRLRDLWSRMVK